MIITTNVGLSFGGRKLFEDVNIKFTPGNCYGLIGANGAGKSTFLKILSGEIEFQKGSVDIANGKRLSVLRQDHFAYEEYTVLQTVMMGDSVLTKIMEQKEALYSKPDFSDEDGIAASELEAKFNEMNGWERESEAASIIAELDLGADYLPKKMQELTGAEKVKVLLAQALLGNPDILLLDEPTNHLDLKTIQWLENFLLNFENTVIVVSHDRHFLNKVCTHIADIDFGKITCYPGNYDFWKKSSELAQSLRSNQNKKLEEKAQELKAFIARFSANASKSKQATSRQKQLEKLELVDLPVSTRKYPFVNFEQKRELGKDILRVDRISKTIDGEKLLDNISFTINKNDKVAFLSKSDLAKTVLFKILMGEIQPDSGTFTWGITTSRSYFPNDNSSYFNNKTINVIEWLGQYSEDTSDYFLKGLLGKMLFGGEEVLKKACVLSGGEKVRCMFASMMLSGANVLIMDGPTSHLDLESITSINDGLIRYKGAVLFTSHDHEFVQTVANRIIHIESKLINDKYTTFDDYLGLA